jgi:H+/gluconate symporter-like permease
MFEVCNIFLSIALLVFLAHNGFSVLILAPAAAALALSLCVPEPFLAYYTQIFMAKLSDFVMAYFPLFLLSAIFGKLMESSGSAKSIANHMSDKIGPENAILAVVLSCSILTYGGVSLFVVAFTVYPIAVELFRKSATPKRLIPAAIGLGSFTYTMVSMPGTPAIQNAIPSQYFGTDTFAAPGIGLICSGVMLFIGLGWLGRQLKAAQAQKEGYGDHNDDTSSVSDFQLPNFWTAAAPIAIVILLNYACVRFIFPSMNTAYLAGEKFGAVELKNVAGNWAIIVAVFFAAVFLLMVHRRRIEIAKTLNAGAIDSLAPIFNTASVVGYGAIINGMEGFAIIKNWALSLFSGNPILSSALMTGVLGGITGSASGGMSISLQMMGAKYAEMARAAGIDPEMMHRIVSIASASLNTLPHNGAVITLLAVCGLTHRDSYKDVFATTLIGPFIATIVAIVIHSVFGAF